MKKAGKKRKWWKILIICLCVILLPIGYIAALLTWQGRTEPVTTATLTNASSSIYSLEEFKKELKPYKGLYEEAIVKHKDEPESGTYVIPGLESTRTLMENGDGQSSVCTGMTPQGITVSDKYMFISAYCHTKRHNSVIYMLDKETHKFIKEIVLPNKAHVGSLAYDNEFNNLWVCGNRSGIAQVNAISIEEIEAYHFEEEFRPIRFLHVNNILDIPRSSFMTYYNSYLYVGYFSRKTDGMIKKYEVQDNGNIENVRVRYDDGRRERHGVAAEDDLVISRQTQGMTFLGDMLFLSSSFGIMPSKLSAFQVSDGIRNFTDEMALKNIRLPYMLEQICVDDGTMYLLFESAAYAYRQLPGIAMERVVKIDFLENEKTN